jgi:asparagine synthase (glutamine-hydrolysing)
MYAFAIWDTRDQALFLARDPFGIKPLYLADDGATLRFASQVKALLAGGGISTAVSSVGECGFWIWGHVPEPLTFYEDIRAFEPGTWLRILRGGRRQSGAFESVSTLLQLHQAGDEGNSASGGATPRLSTLRDAVLDSVRHHLVADVPVGLFLSAGIDSATLTALAVECGGTLRTVTLGFEEYRGTAADETLLAEEVARQYGTCHQTVWLGRRDLEDAFGDFIESMDQPSIDGLNSWLVSRAAAESGLKVAISGLGGDEFFGGYPSFRQLPAIHRLARSLNAIPGLGVAVRKVSAPIVRRFTSEKYAGLLEYGATWEGAYLLRRALRMPWELTCHGPAIPCRRLESQSSDAASVRAIVSHLEATLYMRNQLLRDTDWAGMAHSIELRVPLVDVELTRFLSSQRRVGRVYGKRDLARSADPPLPNELLQRPKTGFTVPVRDWMRPDPDDNSAIERGLRGWQRTVRANYLASAGAIRIA